MIAGIEPYIAPVKKWLRSVALTALMSIHVNLPKYELQLIFFLPICVPPDDTAPIL